MIDQPFAAQVTAALASDLVKRLFDAGSSLFKRTFAAPARATALEKATALALDAAISSFDLDQVEFDHFQTIFTAFLRRPGVLTQLENVIHPQPGVEPSLPALKAEFIASGGDPEFPASFEFDQFITSFIAAFYDQASTDPVLTTAIQINLLRRLVDTSTQSTGINLQSLAVLQDIRDRLTAPTSSHPPPIPHQIPSPPDDFTGRDTILKKLNRAHTAGKRVFLIHGFSGIGKTALSYAFARHLEHYYPDAQINVDLLGTNPSPMLFSDAMAQVIRAWHPDEKIPEKQQELAALYQSVLHGKHVLLLLDNARELPQLEPLIPPIGCCLLVTSRFYMAIPGQESLDLEILSPHKAVQLLRKIVTRIDKESASILAEYCAYIPLALRVSSGALSLSSTISIPEFLSQFEHTQSRLHLTGMGASLQVSYDLLSEGLQTRLSFLSVFPAPFDRHAAAAIWDVDEPIAQTDLDSLVNASLLEYDETTSFRLHDLVRDFAVAKLTPSESYTASLRHASHYLEVARQADAKYLQGGDRVLESLRLFDLHWPHIRQGQAWASAMSETNKAVARLCSRYPDAVKNYLTLRFPAKVQIGWRQAALTIARQLGDKEGESVHLLNLGVAYLLERNVKQGIKLFEQALEIDREIGNRKNEGADLGNLGHAFSMLGQEEQAIQYFQHAIAIAQEVGDRKGEENRLGNLGNTYAKMGQFEKAIENYQQALIISREIGDREGEGNSFGSLGIIFMDLGKTENALDNIKQALEIAQEIGDRRGEALRLSSLGNAYFSLGQYKDAIDYHHLSLVIVSELGDRYSEIHRHRSLGTTFLSLGQYEYAIEHYQQALDITRKLGARSGEGNLLSHLGHAYQGNGLVEVAIDHFQQALTIYRELNDRRSEGFDLGYLGYAYYILNQYEKSIQHCQQALAIARELGNRHSEGNLLGNLGNAYRDLGQIEKAIDQYQQALLIAREIGDRRNEGVWLGSLGLAYSDVGQVEEAIDQYQQTLLIACEIGDRRGEGIHLGNLALLFEEHGDLVRAVPLASASLAIRQEIKMPANAIATMENLLTRLRKKLGKKKFTAALSQPLDP